MAFGRRLGELDTAPLAKTGKEKARAHPEIIVVSNVMENGVPIGVSARCGSRVALRQLVSRRAAVVQRAVCAGDSAGGRRHRICEHVSRARNAACRFAATHRRPDHQARHDLQQRRRPARGLPAGERCARCAGPHHPIIRTHAETGYNALYLGRRPNAYIDGLPVAESEQLLDALWAHATQSQFTWHHQWRVGDLLMWDNRCVMHHRAPFDAGARRVMHRIQGKGDKPVRRADAKTTPHPRAGR